jgi:tRNA modification GTPase
MPVAGSIAQAPPTIFALSSGQPPAAIAIVRISGPRAGAALEALAGPLPAPRYARVRDLRDPGDGSLLDRALILWLPGSRTVSGEDMAELHLHGGRAVIAAVLASLARIDGLRPAEAGEFTRRAFANGRIDLAEAEGLADLLTAETESQRRQAMRLAEGGLGRLIDAWRQRALAIAAQIEAMIDHDDEADVPDRLPVDEMRALAADIDAVLAQPPAERLRDGLRIVVAGPPNAGKSTLINALAAREVALTSTIAGTTRDLVEAPVILDGLPCILIDSAGLREGTDPIERAGIARARDAIAGADLCVWLGDPAEAPAEALIVHAQCDIRGEVRDALNVSAMTGQGMAALRAALVKQAKQLTPIDMLALNNRHRVLLTPARDALSNAALQHDSLLAAEELRFLLANFDAVTGRAGTEEMLDALFARFCIGK